MESEYSQDIRYWYGTGFGTQLEEKLMLPFLTQLVARSVDGSNTTYASTNSTPDSTQPC